MDISNCAVQTDSHLIALLGPTNTGKTFEAMEMMLNFESGVIGFPLRLLARENYDRLCRIKGVGQVALMTGEEKIIPPNARYFMCTVESMPMEKRFAFVGVDEIQLCADPERGHVFTDRLLRARGDKMTVFMGADTIRNVIKTLVPDVDVKSRERFSALTYRGYKKISRMPKRTAIVAFSMNDVYEIAEHIRRQRGGTAVVLGALSPRTRNSQVEMYQSGEVDFLVATDAIGMGLNMDIHHVALAGTRKFDGQKLRPLSSAEIGQVAGRAGRYKRDGSFGVTHHVQSLDPSYVEAIQSHRFEPVKSVYWRNSTLSFTTLRDLQRSLERSSGNPMLVKGRESEDVHALTFLAKQKDILERAQGSAAVAMLWEACQIPDFEQTMNESHRKLISDVFCEVIDSGVIAETTIKRNLSRLDRVDGDVDTLMARLAYIRTWTYITHKPKWLDHAETWQEQARQIEDKLSDALHEALIRRFVDRRSATLVRAMEDGRELLAGIKATGEVVVEGEHIGHLDGFRFIPDVDAKGSDYTAVMKVARQALKTEIKRRANQMIKADDKQFQLSAQGEVLYQPAINNPVPGKPVATLTKGTSLLIPKLDILDSDLIADQDKAAVEERIKVWLDAYLLETLLNLAPLENPESVSGAARGIAFQLFEAFGILPRENVEDLIADLEQDDRSALRSLYVRMGPVFIYLPALMKPAAIRLKALLWSLWYEKPLPAEVPADGVTSFSVVDKDVDKAYLAMLGYPVYGNRAIRLDMLDRLVVTIYDAAEGGTFRAEHKMAEWLGCSIDDLYTVLSALGHFKVEGSDETAEASADSAEATEAAEAADKDLAVDADGNAEKTAVIEGTVEKPQGDMFAAPAADADKPEAADEDAADPAEEVKDAGAAQAEQKPVLAMFRLKKGKAYKSKRAGGGRKNFKGQTTGGEQSHGGKKRGKKGKKGNRGKERLNVPAPKKVVNSPFAALADMNIKTKDD